MGFSLKNSSVKFRYYLTGWRLIDERGNILIFENSDRTELLFGDTVYSIIRKGSIYTHSYFDYFLPLAYVHEQERALLIGLGGGTIPIQLARLFGGKLKLDVVESNRDMVELAKKHFLDGVYCNITIADGAKSLSNSKKRYTLIMLDAYVDQRIPPQFLDGWFVEDANNSLTDDGILAINLISLSGMENYINELKKQFKVYSLKSNLVISNVILICSKKFTSREIAQRINARMKRDGENGFLIERYRFL